MTITELIVCIVAGLGAGLGTGLAGLSAAAVVSPMLITFLHMPAYQAIGIALASDVLASGVSAWTYKKNKNIDIRHGVIMLISVLIFTLVGSFVSSLVPNGTIMTFTALTGAVSHFYIGGKPNLPIMIACVISTLVFAQLGAKWANSANVKMLNRVTGILLCVLGMVMLFF